MGNSGLFVLSILLLSGLVLGANSANVTAFDEVTNSTTPMIRGVNDTVILSAFYYKASNNASILNAACTAIVYHSNGTGIINTSLIYNSTNGIYQKGVIFNTSGIYNWNVTCSRQNHDTANATVSGTNILPSSCVNVFLSINTTLYEDMFCTSQSGKMFILEPGVTLNCNGHTIGDKSFNKTIYRPGVYIGNKNNDGIKNCKLVNFTYAIDIQDGQNIFIENITTNGPVKAQGVNNMRIDGFNFTAERQQNYGILTYNVQNFTVRNGEINNYQNGIYIGAIAGSSDSNVSINNVTISNSTRGVYSHANYTQLENMTFIQNVLSINLVNSYENTLENLVIQNSVPSAYYNSTVIILANNSIISNLQLQNSTGVEIQGNNTLNVSTGNVIEFLQFVGNNSFLTVIFNDINFSSMGTTVTYPALILNITNGTINLTNYFDFFQFANTHVFLNTTLAPELSQPAIITLPNVSYLDNNAYQILKNDNLCEEPNCFKISSSPVSFNVTGFSNYSTRLTPIPPAPVTSSGGGGGSFGGSGGTSLPTNTSNQTNTSVLINQTQIQEPVVDKNETISNTPIKAPEIKEDKEKTPSQVTGLFTIGSQEQTIIGVAILLLIALGIGYWYGKNKN